MLRFSMDRTSFYISNIASKIDPPRAQAFHDVGRISGIRLESYGGRLTIRQP